ncbi:MAG: triose-phosphate isomerase [Flavobacteriales bacterium]|jgi:triosephosphate isomerase|nr:triose-phosphate isomerase [Flavobacteriales bacterium]MBT3963368.1 triose-phosphate isomerase [Flavobacteriales bacterium]MBT4704492.1 triose-phosphate isomerase [Flavobacteriales bacterium]MBT4931247.1 triose-phosphate isomerase [Flavobacteriales bacterium]MBT5131976.1 triose-phosphate isomerase [Flavobacteriales bacterium]
MRRKLVAGNWKMNLHWNEAMSLVSDLVKNEKDWNCDVLICPPSPYVRHTFEFLKNAKSAISVGAQDCASSTDGAFTGEISAGMLSSIGSSFVLVGHSERREYQGERGETLTKKLQHSIGAGIQPIFCCGEKLDERQSNNHFDVVQTQLEEALFAMSNEEISKCTIAYEPVWAIGTGETASPEQAQEMHSFIRDQVATKYGDDVASRIRILYGGSVNAGNAKELFGQQDIDGGLVGGASLKIDSFLQIIQSA